MASGHNRGKLSKQAVAGVGGFTSGRSNAYKKGPGVPGKKSKRGRWLDDVQPVPEQDISGRFFIITPTGFELHYRAPKVVQQTSNHMQHGVGVGVSVAEYLGVPLTPQQSRMARRYGVVVG